MKEIIVDVEKAQKLLEIVQRWGERPENSKHLIPARRQAYNSLMGMVVAGNATKLFKGTPESNGEVYDKLQIAFDIGYFFQYIRADL